MDILVTIIEAIDDPFLLSIILLTFMLAFVFKNQIIKAVKTVYYSAEVSTKYKILSLANHDVFPTMIRVKNEVGNMKFYTGKEFDRVKTLMCYDFTKHKVEHCARRMQDIIDTPDIDSMNKNALKKFVFDEQTRMHEDYIRAVKEEWRIRGVDIDDIDYVIHLFEKFRYDVVASFENRINGIFSNDNYNTNFKLMLAVFEMWSMGIDLLPRDMLTTFESLNGKFKNLTYRK